MLRRPTDSRRFITAGAVATALLASASPAAAAPLPCTGDPSAVTALALTVQGQAAPGLYAVPTVPPRGLVVFFHGYTDTAEEWREHLARTAQQDGVIAVAMNYRGLKPAVAPEDPVRRSTGMPLLAGEQDGVAAAQAFDRACPGLPRIVAYGNSMGGGVAGLAVAARAHRADGRPLFDQLLTTAGLSNIIEGWAELKLAAATVKRPFFVQGASDLEAETGGNPLTAASAYNRRSSTARVDDIARSGVAGATLIHGIDDGTVPSNMSIELALGLSTRGVPVDLYLVASHPAGPQAGTTLENLVLSAVGQSIESPFSGHPPDADANQFVAVNGFARLHAIFSGATPPDCLRVTIVDAHLASSAPGTCLTPSQVTRLLRTVQPTGRRGARLRARRRAMLRQVAAATGSGQRSLLARAKAAASSVLEEIPSLR